MPRRSYMDVLAACPANRCLLIGRLESAST